MKDCNVSIRNYRICSRHFCKDDYVKGIPWKLKRDVTPRPFPCGENNEGGNLPCTSTSNATLVKIDTQTGEQKVDMSAGIEEVSHKGFVGKMRKEKSVFRGISDVSKVYSTPRKQKLIKVIESKESHIRKLKKIANERSHCIRSICDLSESKAVRQLFKDMPSKTADFMVSQLRCATRKAKGRRWTLDEKIVALVLLKRSRRCYSLLRKLVIMPSRKTLVNLLCEVPFESGINICIFEHIKDSLKSEKDKASVLIFDEMDIKEHLEYDKCADRIRGFEELGNHFSNKLANKALVFMVQGLARNWKQPIAYYFSNNSVPAEILKILIFEVIDSCHKIANLDIVATICDMGTTNVRALRELGSSIDNPFIEVEGKKIFNIYDPPHLLKCTMSLFRKHNVSIPVPDINNETMEASFKDILLAYDIDSHSPLIFRSMHKIKPQHLDSKMKFTMKVNLAAQIMSRTVAAFLYTLLSRGELDQRSIATATFVYKVDELFDSFNGSQKVPLEGKELKTLITESSPHID